eukprot:2537798-Rhodomonas_salina.1
MVLRARYERRGTDGAYGATAVQHLAYRHHAQPPEAVRCCLLPTRALRHARYCPSAFSSSSFVWARTYA